MPTQAAATSLGRLTAGAQAAQLGGSVLMGIGSAGSLAVQIWQIRAERVRLSALKLPNVHRAKLAFLFRHSILLVKLKSVLSEALGPREAPGENMHCAEAEAARAWIADSKSREQAALEVLEVYESFDSLLCDDAATLTPLQVDRVWYRFKLLIVALADGRLGSMQEMKPCIQALVGSYKEMFPPIAGQQLHFYSAKNKGSLHQHFRCKDDFTWPVAVVPARTAETEPRPLETQIKFKTSTVNICHEKDMFHIPSRLIWPDPPEFGPCDKFQPTAHWQLLNYFDESDSGPVHVGDTVKLFNLGGQANLYAKSGGYTELDKKACAKDGLAFTITRAIQEENY